MNMKRYMEKRNGSVVQRCKFKRLEDADEETKTIFYEL